MVVKEIQLKTKKKKYHYLYKRQKTNSWENISSCTKLYRHKYYIYICFTINRANLAKTQWGGASSSRMETQSLQLSGMAFQPNQTPFITNSHTQWRTSTVLLTHTPHTQSQRRPERKQKQMRNIKIKHVNAVFFFFLNFWNASDQETKKLLSCATAPGCGLWDPPTTRLNISPLCSQRGWSCFMTAKCSLKKKKKKNPSPECSSSSLHRNLWGWVQMEEWGWAACWEQSWRQEYWVVESLSLSVSLVSRGEPFVWGGGFKRQWRSKACCASARRRRWEDAAGSRAAPGPVRRQTEGDFLTFFTISHHTANNLTRLFIRTYVTALSWYL